MAHSISSSFVRLRLKELENVNWFPAFFALDCLPCDVNVFIIWKSLAGFRLLRKWRSLQTVRPILLIKKKKHKKELYLVTFLIIWLCRVGNYYYCWVICCGWIFFFWKLPVAVVTLMETLWSRLALMCGSTGASKSGRMFRMIIYRLFPPLRKHLLFNKEKSKFMVYHSRFSFLTWILIVSWYHQ